MQVKIAIERFVKSQINLWERFLRELEGQQSDHQMIGRRRPGRPNRRDYITEHANSIIHVTFTNKHELTCWERIAVFIAHYESAGRDNIFNTFQGIDGRATNGRYNGSSVNEALRDLESMGWVRTHGENRSDRQYVITSVGIAGSYNLVRRIITRRHQAATTTSHPQASRLGAETTGAAGADS